jgi:hypothetical protein
MELTGKIIQILPIQQGKSAKGEWQKQDFIVETQEQYPKKICISVWNNKIEINSLSDKLVKVFIYLESREYNDRWYTDVKAWKVEILDQETASQTQILTNNESEPGSLPGDIKDGNEDLPF